MCAVGLSFPFPICVTDWTALSRCSVANTSLGDQMAIGIPCWVWLNVCTEQAFFLFFFIFLFYFLLSSETPGKRNKPFVFAAPLAQIRSGRGGKAAVSEGSVDVASSAQRLQIFVVDLCSQFCLALHTQYFEGLVQK